jgi:hypothetical protein
MGETMPAESAFHSRSPEELKLYMRLLNDADSGSLDNLECPSCRQTAVSVWFTHPAEDIYRTWFVCTHSRFHSRAQNNGIPAFFTANRLRPDLQEGDLSVLKQAVFEKPQR